MAYVEQANLDEVSEVKSVQPVARKYPRTIPVLPIRDSVYFPGQMFPLFLGREKSIRAMDAAMDRDRLVLLCAQKDVETEDPTPDEIYNTGVIAEVMQVLRVPDGTVRISLEAIERARATQFVSTDPFFLARVKMLPTKNAGDTASEALMRSVISLFEQVVQNQVMGASSRPIPPELLMNVVSIDDPARLADTIVPHLPIKLEIKQDLLETTNAQVRLEKLHVVLTKEMEVLDIQRNIRSRVEKEMGDTQRDYILREQLKAIQQELGEHCGGGSEVGDYKTKIAEANMPEAVAEKSLKEVDRLDRMPFASPEGAVVRNYLDWLLALPWNTATQDSLDIDKATHILEEKHYGLEKVKERVIEFLAVRKLSGDLKGPILCFVGPPGVGKTSIGKSIAESMDRKFYRMSLGGVRDEAEIRGHRRTYVGSMPGRIIHGVKQVGTNNPVFMLDEIDKLGMDFRGDPSSALLEALDPEQNDSFVDNYLEVPFNLRNVMFITTANMLETIPPALRDRMEVIRFSGYIEEEKMHIARRFLLPKQIKENGLSPELLDIRDSALHALIRHHTREAGVRELERTIASVCRKVATKVAKGKVTRTTVRETSLVSYLGAPRYHYGSAEEQDCVAVATGLVYTEVGGDIVSIEAVPTKSDKGNLTLTGQLGDVMRESGQAALTYVRSRAAMLGLEETFYSHTDIHVHVPAGAVPKDGPSAGVTLATAIASALTGRAVRKDVAMTGEITLTGRVLPVGGIKEKMLAAHRSGIRTVILPKQNEADLDELPKKVRAEMSFILVKHADEVLNAALMPLP